MKRLDLSDGLLVLGLLLTALGAGWIYPPLGLVVPGVVLFALGVRLAGTPPREPGRES